MTQESSHNFSVLNVLEQALEFCKHDKRRLFNSLKYPGLCMLLIFTIKTLDTDKLNIYIRYIYLILGFYFYTIFAVLCHRTVLLSEFPTNPIEIFSWNKINTHFLIFTVVIPLAVGLVFIFPIGYTPKVIAFNWLYVTILSVPAGYISSRLSLILPSVAIGNRASFTSAWKISSNYGWKLFLLLAFPPIMVGLILEQFNTDIIFIKIITEVISLALLTFEIILLSFSYKELTGQIEST